MATKITFETVGAITVYTSMAEGMWDNADDDRLTPRAALLDSLLNLLTTSSYPAHPESYPLTVDLPDELVEPARAVLENCLDNSTDVDPEDEDACEFIFAGQVIIADDAPAAEWSFDSRAGLTPEQRDAIITLIERVELTFDNPPKAEANAIAILEKLIATKEEDHE